MARSFDPNPVFPSRGMRLSLGGLVFLAFSSCLSTRVEDDLASGAPLRHYAHFRHGDSSSLPDSLWFQSPLDSGSASPSWTPGARQVVFFPDVHPLGKDSLRVETWTLGLRTGSHYLKEVVYGELAGTGVRNTLADSTARRLLSLFDSLQRRTGTGVPDDSASTMRETLRQAVAKLVFQGHPATATLRKAPPLGLDTADLVRRSLELALKSDLSLAQVTQRWTLGLDYSKTRQILASRGIDSLPLNPFRIVSPLALDTLHLGEPGAGLKGGISARLGIHSLTFTLSNDSGDRTDRFVVSDAPSLPVANLLDLSGHPAFAPRATAALGGYTLKLTATDSLGNTAAFRIPVWVEGPLDHSGPSLEVLDPAWAVVRAFKDSQLVVRAKADDPSGVALVKIGGAAAQRGPNGIWFGQILVPVSPDSRQVEIEALDSAGNSRTARILVRREEPPEPTPPRLHLVSPAPGTLVPFDSAGAMVVWTAATDFGTIDTVTIGGKPARNTGDSTWEVRLDLPPSGGLSDIVVRAHSTWGLASTNYVPVGRRKDTLGPTVRWVSPSSPHRVGYEVDTLQVAVSVSDPSGVDSVRIGGKRPDTAGGIWLARVDLAPPGEVSRIRIMAWDRSGNVTDSVLSVSRDPIPAGLRPIYRWIQPSEKSGTVVPFDSTGMWIRCVVKDISGIDASSVEIGGLVATALDDSTWVRHVDLPPTGKETLVTLEAKNKRGLSSSSFVYVTRRRDTIAPTCVRIPPPRVVVPFDTTALEVGWTARDNDRIAKAWIRGRLVEGTTQGFSAKVPLSVGGQWIPFRAEDPAGNFVLDSLQVERRPDTIPPRATRNAGTTARTVPFDTTTVEVGWMASDNDRVANAWIQDLSANPISGSVVSRVPLAVGKQWVKLLVEDAVGNLARDSVEIQRLADTARPKVVAMAHNRPRTVAWDTSAILAGWTATDNDRVAKAWIQDVQVAATSEGFSRLVPLDTGTQWIRFRAVDPTGNESLDSFRMERLPMDTADPVAASDTNSRLRGGSFLVELSTTTPGGRIHYTLDGSEPTESSPRYGSEPKSNHDGQWGVWIDTSCTLKARAFATNRSPGRILTQSYRLALPVAVAGGLGHSLFLLSDGSLWGAGSNARNAFKSGDKGNFLEPVKIADSVVEMSAGREYSLWLKRDGTLWGIGANDSGQLGVGNKADAVVPVLVASKVKSAQAILEERILVLKEDGSLWGAGANCYGQLGTGDLVSPNLLVPIQKDVVRFGGGGPYSMFVKKDGSLWSMGSPYHGKLGFDTSTWVTTPRKVMDSIAEIAGTMTNSSLVLTTSGRLLGFGWNHDGQLGSGDTAHLLKPTPLPLFETEGRIVKVVSRNHTLALTENGTLLGAGWNVTLALNTTLPEINPTPVVLMRGVHTMGIGLGHSFAITKSGCLFGWGANNNGQLGTGSIGWIYEPTRVRF